MGYDRHSYTLHYFDIRGRAEPIRLIFEYFGVKFTDHRIAMDDWPKLKTKAPMQQLPYLEVDGGKITLCQTTAICRYLAKSLKPDAWFAGETKSDSARCDMYVECFFDLFQIGAETKYEKDAKIKEKKTKHFAEVYPKRLDLIEEHLKKAGGKYFVALRPTWTDLVAICVLSALEEMNADFLKKHKALSAYYNNIRGLPEIRDYITANWPESQV